MDNGHLNIKNWRIYLDDKNDKPSRTELVKASIIASSFSSKEQMMFRVLADIDITLALILDKMRGIDIED